MALTKKNAQEYNKKIEGIPKDYMDRLAYIYKAYGFKKADIDDLMSKIDKLQTEEWNKITYIFYMDPHTSPRPRYKPNTKHFYVKNAKDHKQLFDDFQEAHSNTECVISTPCMIDVRAYKRTPSNMNIKEKMAAELELIHCLESPDWDNLGKTYSDMVQKTLVSDDSIVCRGMVEKFYSIIPRVEVDIYYMKSYDCLHNKRRIEKRKSFYENPLTIKDIAYII